MAAERVQELFGQFQALGIDTTTPGISQILAQVLARFETDLKADVASSAAPRGDKSWTHRVIKDENTFRFDNKGTDPGKGYTNWKFYFEMSMEQHCPQVLEEMKAAEQLPDEIP